MVIELTCVPFDLPAAPPLPAEPDSPFVALPEGVREQSHAENDEPPSKHVCRPTEPLSQVQRQTSPGTQALAEGAGSGDEHAESKKTTLIAPPKEVARTSPSRH
jgi:hypothetical protein